MDNPITRKSWSPYVVGAAIGVLSWFAFATADKPLGITTALVEKEAILNFERTNTSCLAFHQKEIATWIRS